MIELKDVSDVFPEGNSWKVYGYSYDEKSLRYKLELGTGIALETYEDVVEVFNAVKSNSVVNKVSVKAVGKFFKDLNKGEVEVHTWEETKVKTLPRVDQFIKYREGIESGGNFQVLYVDKGSENIVVKHVWNYFGEEISFFGIPFCEYFEKMEEV